MADVRPADLASYREFLDDAAVFPPGLAPLDIAVRDHLQRRSLPAACMVGPLLLALDQVETARALALDAASAANVNLLRDPLQVGIIIPAGGLNTALRVAAEMAPEARIVGLELKTSPTEWRVELEEFQQTATEVARYVELDSQQIADGALAALREGPVKLKFRTGGLVAGLFPSTTELASVIIEAVRHNVPFKLTAGLHQAVRQTASTGLTHHGFLNIAVATALTQNGSTLSELVDVLEERDGTRLAQRYLRLGMGWRRHFESFGTCSVLEPLESLTDLNLIPLSLLQESKGTP